MIQITIAIRDLLSGGLDPTFQDVLLEQSEETLPSDVVPGRTDAAHRPDHLVTI